METIASITLTDAEGDLIAVEVVLTDYEDGYGKALLLYAEEAGELDLYADVTTNLSAYDIYPNAPDEVFIRDDPETRPVLRAMKENGILQPLRAELFGSNIAWRSRLLLSYRS